MLVDGSVTGGFAWAFGRDMRLALRHPDVAALRRYLVDEGLVERAQGIYRLTAAGEALARVTAPSPA